MEWISVKDKIPETANQDVLILDSDMCIDIGRLISIDYKSMIMKWEWGSYCCKVKNYNITHWMPLPELLKD